MRLAVREYVDADGTSPFRTWLDRLDVTVRARIQARILRFEAGNLGDHKALRGGIYEARLTFGPGYRLYFGKAGHTVLLLLLGGDKASQGKDIRRARRYWVEYRKETGHATSQS